MAADVVESERPVPALEPRATAAAAHLQSAETVLLISHIDADGLSSAAIAAQALQRAEISCEVSFAKQLDDNKISAIANTEHDTVLFTDFGSGQLDLIEPHIRIGAFSAVVADHHQPANSPTTDALYHLNPLCVGIDGAAELSGAGTTYALARALEASSRQNCDLAALAVIGAIGDMQGTPAGLSGANEQIVTEAIEAGVLESTTDLLMYGRQTRPLPKLLEYAGDVQIPGITSNSRGVNDFLSGLEFPLRADGEWRRWIDLTREERQTLVNNLLRRAISTGVPADRINDLIGETYILSNEDSGTELRDVSEFSTLLNATARYERADVGLAVCLGNRGAALTRAQTLLRNHRQNLSEGVQLVQQEGTTIETNLQWFDAGNQIRETIIGIIAGMSIGSEDIRGDLPILAFARQSESMLKVSARGSYGLVNDGLDLSAVMSKSATVVGGEGGGHDIAAGATIPVDKKANFLQHADEQIGTQLHHEDH